MLLKRPQGYEIPKLKYGEEISIENELSRKSINGERLEIEIGPETKIGKGNGTLSAKRYFLSGYAENQIEGVNEIAFRLFGFPRMYSFQHRILDRVLHGRSILGIAATGSGKSECFILPAVALPGITIVISPLISLMMDQYDQRITSRYGLNGITTFINGEVTSRNRQTRLRRMELGYFKLVYFTPEQLQRSYVLDSLKRADQNVGIRYLAMDEAHCISQWGHDFRPAYLNILRRLGDRDMHPVRIALTATASPNVREDICSELKLNPALLDAGGDLLVDSSNRPELNLIVRVKRTTDEKVRTILDHDLELLLKENENNMEPGAAIIFMPETGGDPEHFSNEPDGSKRGKLSAGVSGFASFLERKLQKRVSIYHSKMDLDGVTGDLKKTKPRLGILVAAIRRSEQKCLSPEKQTLWWPPRDLGWALTKTTFA